MSNQKFLTPLSQPRNSLVPERRTPQRLFGAGRVPQPQNRVQIAALSSKRNLDAGQDEKFFTPASEFSTHKPGLHDHRQSTAIRGFRRVNVPNSNLAQITETSHERPRSLVGLKNPQGFSKPKLFGQKNFQKQPTSFAGLENGFNQSFGE